MEKPKNRKNISGFTLGEIITTVAVIGTITALAVPNYLRIRMNTNMELVRQQMRIVAEKMTEIMTKKGQYPDPAAWPENMNPSDPDEASLMGNLSAIDEMCYTNAEYFTNESKSTYRFCTGPKTDACGRRAGTKRFCVHSDSEMSVYFAPGIVGELPPTVFEPPLTPFDYAKAPIIGSIQISYETNAGLLLNFLEQSAYYFDIKQMQDILATVRSDSRYESLAYLIPPNDPASNGIYFSPYSGGYYSPPNYGYEGVPIKNLANFNSTLRGILPELRNRGIDVSVKVIADLNESNIDNYIFGYDYVGGSILQIGFLFTDPQKRLSSAYAAQQKLAELSANPNGTIYGPNSGQNCDLNSLNVIPCPPDQLCDI